MKKNRIMNFFSDLGRSLMMPIAALAACGIVLGLTAALTKPQVLAAVPFIASGVPYFIITTLKSVSNIVFTLMPVLFSISIAMGMAKIRVLQHLQASLATTLSLLPQKLQLRLV